MLPYIKEFTVPAVWASISATSLLFVGTITALAANGTTVALRRKSAPTISDSRSLVASAWIEYRVPADLADIEWQDGAGTAIVMLDGNVVAQSAPLANVK